MKRGRYEVFVEGRNVEVDAYLFSLPEYGEFIVHRTPDSTPWQVSEPRSGYAVGMQHKTKKEALVEVEVFLSKYTPAEIDDARESALLVNRTTHGGIENDQSNS